VIAWHVDMWDEIGWKDPFSLREGIKRHEVYGRRFENYYTPQAVIDGRAHEVGSDRKKIRAALQREGSAALRLDCRIGAEGLVAEVSAGSQARVDTKDVDLIAVLVEDGLVTEVKAGENKGKRLHDNGVARRVLATRPVGQVPGRVAVPLELDANAARSRLGVVVFLQDRKTLEVHQARIVRLSAVGAATRPESGPATRAGRR
jgi:hypothetical protein